MDTIFNTVSIISGLVLIACVLRVVNMVWLRPKRLERLLRKQGLNGNPYKLLFGDLKESTAMRLQALSKPIGLSDDHVPRSLPFWHKTVKEYGKNSFMWEGMAPTINISDPDLIREAMTKYEEFQRPEVNFLIRLQITGLGSYEGAQWVKHRKIINPAFHLEKLKKMSLAFYESTNEMLSNWEKIITGKGQCEMDIWPDLQKLSAAVISRAAFGGSFEEGTRIFNLQKEQSFLIGNLIRSSYIPGIRYFPTKAKKRMYEIDNQIETLFSGIIHKREMEMKVGEPIKNDLLGILLESNLSEGRNNKNNGLSMKEVIQECKLFYFAGSETTGGALLWTMVMLSKHPEWQERAREEVFQVFGKNKPHADRFVDLKIVTMILYEVLRLYPPVSSTKRRVHKDMTLGKMFIPRGTSLQLQTLMVQQDHDIWGDDAKEFNPDRFSEGILKASNGEVSYFAFGYGPRICIGQNFALIEAKMAITMLLQRFSFELSPSYTHAPYLVITLQPQHGAHLILKKI